TVLACARSWLPPDVLPVLLERGDHRVEGARALEANHHHVARRRPQVHVDLRALRPIEWVRRWAPRVDAHLWAELVVVGLLDVARAAAGDFGRAQWTPPTISLAFCISSTASSTWPRRSSSAAKSTSSRTQAMRSSRTATASRAFSNWRILARRR